MEEQQDNANQQDFHLIFTSDPLQTINERVAEWVLISRILFDIHVRPLTA